jgi:hypothetical protein
MALSGTGCKDAVDESLGVVRERARQVTESYLGEAEQWASNQETYLEDMKRYLAGELTVEPASPGPPPEVPSVGGGGYPSTEDYNKAFGDGFLKYVCDNVVVQFTWNGTGVDSSSGSTVPDPLSVSGFSVSGSNGGGVLAGPGPTDPSKINTFLGNLSVLAAGLVVTLPVGPSGAVFTPATVTFKVGALLSADPSAHVSPSGPSYGEILQGVCEDLISSFKKNFPSEFNCVHFVPTMANVPAGFSGTVSMSSIS